MQIIRRALWAWVVGMIPFSSIAMALSPPSLADLFRDPEFREVRLSPNGQHIAVTLPSGDRTVLVVLKIGSKKPLSQWDYGAGRHISNVFWVNDERIIFGVAEKTGSLDFRIPTPDLYASNIDGSRRRLIPNGNTYQILGRVSDDPDSVWVQRSIEQAFLFKLNTRSGRVVTLASAPLDFGGFVLDHDENIRYAIGRVKNNVIRTLRRDNDSWTVISETELGGNESLMPIAFDADNKRVFMRKSEGGKPSIVIARDPETGETEVVSSDPVADPMDWVSSGDGRHLLAVKYMPDRLRIDLINTSHPEARALAGLVQAFPNQSIDFGNASQDGRLRIFRVFSDNDPGTYYLFDRDTGTAKFILASRPWIKPESMAISQPIRFTARDGLVIHGYVTRPRTADRALPTVVLVHGGPHGPRDTWGFDPSVQALATRGYAVLQINFRGSGGYGQAFERAGYRNWGTTMQDDLTDGVRWAIEQGLTDPDRICIYGGSYGGYAALMSPVREPSLYRCAVGYVGVYSLPMMFDKGDVPRSASGRAFQQRILPETESEQRAQSPAYNVDKLNLPIMLVHGGKDQRVPIDQMDYLIKQMKAVGKTPERVLVKSKEGHGFQIPENNVELYTSMLEFFDAHIGSPASAQSGGHSSLSSHAAP
jgi:dipeptidyl aminopeptidase/acylaminoacyl peptidase